MAGSRLAPHPRLGHSGKRLRFLWEGHGLPAVIDLLKSYFEVEDRDDARRIRETCTAAEFTFDAKSWSHIGKVKPAKVALDYPKKS
jgi:hypothetical protein